jgi:hypothetical protein
VDKGGVMPNYTFRNKKTEEIITVNMSMAEHDTYLNDKPDWEQIIQSAVVVDPVNIGITKPPADFQKYVLGRIKSAVPEASAVASKRWDIPREI